MTDIKTIRLTYEGLAVRWSGGWAHPDDDTKLCIADNLDGVSIEVLEPPYPVGHVVRGTDDTVWVKTKAGWVTSERDIVFDDNVIRGWLITNQVVELFPAAAVPAVPVVAARLRITRSSRPGDVVDSPTDGRNR